MSTPFRPAGSLGSRRRPDPLQRLGTPRPERVEVVGRAGPNGGPIQIPSSAPALNDDLLRRPVGPSFRAGEIGTATGSTAGRLLARPRLAVAARGGPRPVQKWSTRVAASPGPTPVGLAPTATGLVIYELHVGTFTPEGTYAGRHGSPDRPGRPGRDGHRVDAGQRVRRSVELGVRRRGVCSPRMPGLRRRPTSCGCLDRSGARAGPGGDPRRGLQPLRPRWETIPGSSARAVRQPRPP